MRLERLGERNHGVADVVMLLAVVCLALATWSYLGDAATLQRVASGWRAPVAPVSIL